MKELDKISEGGVDSLNVAAAAAVACYALRPRTKAAGGD